MNAEARVALEQVHVGPTDDVIQHAMTPWCLCAPVLEIAQADGDPAAGVQVITYRHNRVGPDA